MARLATTFCGTLLLAALLAPLAATAEGPAPSPGTCRGCGRGAGPGRAFDAGSVTTLQGEVLDVERVERRRHEGVHLVVAMGSEKVAVHLGPAFYVDAQALKLAKGDRVEVKGARTVLAGQPVVVAQEVRRGGEVLALRDGSGVPLWRGQGRNR